MRTGTDNRGSSAGAIISFPRGPPPASSHDSVRRSERGGQSESAIRFAWQLDHVDHCVQIERTVDVRKERFRADVAHARGRFEFESRNELAFVDPQHQKILPSAVKKVRRIENLSAGRAMNETLDLERTRTV